MLLCIEKATIRSFNSLTNPGFMLLGNRGCYTSSLGYLLLRYPGVGKRPEKSKASTGFEPVTFTVNRKATESANGSGSVKVGKV